MMEYLQLQDEMAQRCVFVWGGGLERVVLVPGTKWKLFHFVPIVSNPLQGVDEAPGLLKPKEKWIIGNVIYV